MRGAAIPSHGLACAPPAAVPLNPRLWLTGGVLHRSPQLRSDLPPPAVPCRARSPSSSSSNVNSGRGDDGDADKLLEDLLNKHGEVVYSAGGGGAPAIEADDDAECLSFAVSLAKVASEIDAISSKMRDIGEQQFSKVASGDTKPNSWTLLDFAGAITFVYWAHGLQEIALVPHPDLNVGLPRSSSVATA